jgi:hypothetical protein
MAVHGNFTELTFVNSTTPAINAANLNAIESTLKIADTELARSLSFSWDFYKKMFFNCSQRTINRFLTYTDWFGTNGPTISEANHSESLIHGRAVKMLQPTNDAEELAIFTDAHTQQNLNNFDSLDSANTDQLICLLCYISDTTYITRITVRLGEDTSNYYYYNWTTGLVNGWNILTVAKSSMSTTGSPSGWSAIDYVAYRGLFAANAQNEYVIFNHCAMVRADQSTATLMNPFVGNDYADNWDVNLMTPSSQFLIYKDAQFEEICLLSCMLDGIATDSPDFIGTGLVCSSFSASFRVIARNTSDSQGIMWYVDDDNYLLFHIDDADVNVSVMYGGSLSYYYTAYASDALLLGSTLKVNIEKIGGSTVRMILEDESGTNETIEVSGDALSFTDTTEGEVGIGAYSTTQLSSIQDFVVTNRRPDNINLPDMSIKNNSAYQYIQKASDELRISNTTLSDDNDLKARLAPYGIYKVTVRLNFSAGLDTPDFKGAWTISGDITALTYKSMIGPSTGTSDSANTQVRSSAFAIDASANYGADGSDISQAYEEFILSTDDTGGILQFQWAQNTSIAATVTLREESFMIIEKIADNF